MDTTNRTWLDIIFGIVAAGIIVWAIAEWARVFYIILH
jgi:hypothetical protein